MYGKIGKSHKSIFAAMFFSLVLICSCALLCVQNSGTRAYADEEVAPLLVKHSTDCTYRYFEHPTALYADGNTFTVADGDKLLVFGSDGLQDDESDSRFGRTDKLASLGSDYAVLSEGTLYYSLPDGEACEIQGVADFAIYGDMIYTVDGTTDEISYKSVSDDSVQGTVDTSSLGTPKLIAADRNGIYISYASHMHNLYRDDVAFFPVADSAPNAGYVCITDVDELLGMDGLRSGGIGCYTRDKIVSYRLTSSSKPSYKLIQSYEYACSAPVAISADGDTLYCLGNEKNVFSIDETLIRKDILASALGAKGFFRSNRGIATRKQRIAVADERNNRIQLITENGYETVDGLYNPQSVAIDYVGNMYVAHALNYVDMYDAAGNFVRTCAHLDNYTALVELVIDSDDNLYALGDDGAVYAVTAEETKEIATGVIAITIAQSDNSLYALTDNGKIISPNGVEAKEVASINVTDAVNFCTDHNDSFYILSENGAISEYVKAPNGSYAKAILPETNFVAPTDIVMSTVANTALGIKYGDLLVSDTGSHAVFVLDGKAFGVNRLFDTESKIPTVDGLDTPDSPEEGDSTLIFTAAECDVYAQDAEINPIAKIRNGMRVIAPCYNAADKFSFIIADNTEGYSEDAIMGYVYTSLLTPVPYTDKHPIECYTVAPSVDVYKYPTLNIPKMTTLTKNAALILADFAVHPDANDNDIYGYNDNFSQANVWFKIQYADGENVYVGYVLNDFISMRGENPDDRNVYPRTNATVISKDKHNKDLPALLYEKDEEGNTVAVEDPFFAPLEVGTKVEVVGAFDSSEKYTRIRYYHKGLGTVEFYVETANLRYDGVNKVTIVAIIIIIVTVILGIILIARVVYVKRNRKVGSKI